MRRYDVVAEICDAMQTLGWGPYQNDHEDANGQFEMNWDYDDALVTADRHAFLNSWLNLSRRSMAYEPRLCPNHLHLTGNGCHAHVSVWDKSGKQNLFLDKQNELGLSSLAHHFLGGILKNAEGLCALTNPTVNSYKRINAPVTASGATWSPNTVTWSGNNRTHMVRTPDAGRFEFRLADGAANPYLLQAAYLAAGLDGIINKTDPGKRTDVDMYAEAHNVKAKRLPLYLIDAIRAFGRNKVMKAALGEEFVAAYVKIKLDEWNDFSQHLSQWERANTLDC